jgi:hypothetical protein
MSMFDQTSNRLRLDFPKAACRRRPSGAEASLFMSFFRSRGKDIGAIASALDLR